MHTATEIPDDNDEQKRGGDGDDSEEGTSRQNRRTKKSEEMTAKKSERANRREEGGYRVFYTRSKREIAVRYRGYDYRERQSKRHNVGRSGLLIEANQASPSTLHSRLP